MKYFAVLTALALLLTGQVFGQSAGAKAELKKFEGNWSFESGMKGGEALPAEFENTRWQFKGNTFLLKAPDGNQIKLRFTVDPELTPALIDFTVVADNMKLEGIYKFENQKLILCVCEGKNRPSEFTSTKDNQAYLITLKRSKD